MKWKSWIKMKPAGDAGAGGASGSPTTTGASGGGSEQPPASGGATGGGQSASGGTPPPNDGLPSWVNDPAMGVDDKGRGLVALKKYDTPGAVLKALGHAQEFIGAPADEVFRFKKTGLDAEDRKKLNEKMGVPATPDGYAKIVPASEADTDQTNWFKKTAHELHMTPEQAEGLAKAYADRMKAAEADVIAENEAEKAVAKASLEREWGADMKRRMEVCETAVAELGITKKELGVMKDALGQEGLVKFVWEKIVNKIGEAKFKTQPQTPGGFTPDSARARKAELTNDTDFKNRLASGDLKAAEQKEWTDIHRAIAAAKEVVAE